MLAIMIIEVACFELGAHISSFAKIPGRAMPFPIFRSLLPVYPAATLMENIENGRNCCSIRFENNSGCKKTDCSLIS